MSPLSRLFILPALVVLATCGSDDGTGPGPAARVRIVPESAALVVGEQLQLTALVLDSSGRLITGSTVAWSSETPAVATVGDLGMVTALAPGSATIRAEAAGFSATLVVPVTAAPAGGVGVVAVNPSIRYQTMTGWQAGPQAWHEHAQWDAFGPGLLDRAVNELGLDRVRLGFRSGVENSRDIHAEWLAGTITYQELRCNRYATVNDNVDPFVLRPEGFHFTDTDKAVEKVVLPLRQRLQARGERLYVTLAYLAFTSQNCAGTSYHHTQPEEYAEVVLAAFLHLRDKYGLVPDAFELLNEPDNTTFGPAALAAPLAAIAARLRAHGFDPDFIAPSTSGSASAAPYFDAINGNPAARGIIDEIAYHRYDQVTTATLQGLAQRAAAAGIRTAMGEHNGSGIEDLYEDLTVANASSWEQGALAFQLLEAGDDGTVHYMIDDRNPGVPVVRMASRSRYLSQVFRYVRLGAVRIAASSSDPLLAPVAFINASGRHVVVIRAGTGATIPISGLPAGTYGINYTTASAFNVEAAPVTLGTGQLLQATIPAAGVISVYGK